MSRRSKKKATAVDSSAPVLPAVEMPEVADSRLLKPGSDPAGLNDRWLVFGVCLFLATIVWAVFGQTLHHEFVNYDDQEYVCENPAVIRGLNLKGIEWAFTHRVCANWHPLTMMSHMLDCQWYGLSPGGHHLTNILLHTATAILLFLALRRMTGFLWRSAFVAAVFAIHPLRVESVAWVAERKDVLSGLFFMLTLWAYARYVQRRSRIVSQESKASAVPALDPLARRSETKTARLWTLDYGLVVLFFALGLMSKPMLVTVPLVLLLLDYWPLERFKVQGSTNTPSLHHSTTPPLRLLFEKLPLLGLAIASCVATIYAQTGAIQSFKQISLPSRLGNALISCVAYLGQMFWPSGLAVFYPFTTGSVWVSRAVLSLVVLAGISAGVFVLRRRPYFLTGWLWYLIMLVPVIGLVQVGAQARADRYTYLPQIGLDLMLTWAVAELCTGWRYRRALLGGGATVILAALISCARVQTAYWRDSESLWMHTLACTSDNAVAHNNLSNALFKKGSVDEAIAHCQKALQITPNYADAHYNLGIALLKKGSVDEAIIHFQRALQLKPDYAEAHNNLGSALSKKGSTDEAIIHFQRALQLKPDYAEAHYNFGIALLQNGQVIEAIAHFQKALQLKPDYADAHYNLGNTLFKTGRVDEAMIHYQQALQLKPDYAEAHNNLGNALFKKGRVAEAITQYQQALQLKPDNAEAQSNLGSALCQKGRVDEAIIHFQRALQLKPDYAEAHYNLAKTLIQKGEMSEAVTHFQMALQIKPDYLEAQNNLAWVLATNPDAHIRDGVQAVRYAERACELTHYGVAPLVSTLAAAYAEAGRYDDAIATAQKACALASAAGKQDLLERNQKLLELYRAHQPYHETTEKPVPAAP